MRVSELEAIMAGLKEIGYSPLVGMFGIGVPFFFTGFGPLGGSVGTAVFYFDNNAEQMASGTGAIVSKVLSVQALKPQFVDPSILPSGDEKRFVTENSGLDLQIYLSR